MHDQDFKHNFHTHTFRCKHATGDAADYCAVAVERGMQTLGFSDHAALPDNRWHRERMHYEELDGYVSKAGFSKSGGATVVRKEGRGCAIIKAMKQPIPEKGSPGMLSELFNDTFKVSDVETRLTIAEAADVAKSVSDSSTESQTATDEATAEGTTSQPPIV